MDRVYLTINGRERESFPLDYKSATFVTEREQGQIFYRTRMNGTLTIFGDDYFDLIASYGRCQRHFIRVEFMDDSTWEGFFTMASGEVDMDNCTFKFSPEPMDVYTEVLGFMAGQFDMLSGDTIVIGAPLSPTILCSGKDLFPTIDDLVVNHFGLILSSDFLSAATNPVTGTANKYNLVTIAQTSNVKRPSASEPATEYFMRISDVFDGLRDLLNLYWDIVDGDFVLEHYSHFRSGEIDLSGALGENKVYTTNTDGIISKELFSTMDSQKIYPFWGTETLSIQDECAIGSSNEITRSPKFITDPIGFQADALGLTFTDDGLCIFACEMGPSDVRVILEATVTSLDVINGDFSWYNLIPRFFTHNMGGEDGTMLMFNARYTLTPAVVAQETIPIFIQKMEIDPPATLVPSSYYTTTLGGILGMRAVVMSIERKSHNLKSTITLGYIYET